MGTEIELLLEATATTRRSAEAEDEFRRLESLLSRFQPDSELSRLNRAGELSVGPELLELAELAVAARERTAGRFDPTVHDAVAAAGYDRSFELIDGSGGRPAAARPRCGGRVGVDRAAARVTLEPGYRLDLGGIAKGWAADRVLALLREAGPALVNAGGDVAVAGRPWPVGVDTPDGTITLELDRGGLATSGRDRRRWRQQGQERHHLIDPATALPAEGDLLTRDRRRAHRRRGGGAREDPLPRRQRGAGDRRGGSPRRPRRARHARRRDAARRRTRVKSDPTFWILARASGLMAYALLTSSVLAGLVLKARPFGRSLQPATVTDVHRFLALLGLGALVLHAHDARPRQRRPHLACGALRPRPRPLPACLDVLRRPRRRADAARSTPPSRVRRRIGTRVWRRLHWFTYLVFALATVHGLAAGTDSGTPWALAFYGAAVGSVLAATGWRALVPPTQGGQNRVPNRDRPHAV